MTAAATRAGREQAHSGFLHHRRHRWAKISFALCLGSIVAYGWHQPPSAPNGGTWLGYTLGTIGALLIVWLAWLGVRKRRYASNLGSVKGWTSAHVYLGLSLIVVATLHCGFQFGANIHTAAYVLMLLVIGSGLWGIVAYSQLPQRVTRLRDGGTREAWIAELFDLNEQSIRLADALGPDVHRRVVASAEKIRIGGGLFAQLARRRVKPAGQEGTLEALLGSRLQAAKQKAAVFDPNNSRQSTVAFMAGQMVATDRDAETVKRIQQVLDLVARRNALAQRINDDIRLHTQMQLWLLVHVPLTFALIAALIAHVVSVFYYW